MVRRALPSSLFFSLFVIGCSGPSFTPAALPQLAAVDATKPQLLHVPKLLLEPGEHFAFNVRLHGIEIGRAELDVTATQAASKFKTNDVAGAFATVQDEATTTLDRVGARAAASTEVLIVDGDTKTFDHGNGGQSVHTALGVIRAWAKPGAAPGFLMIDAAGKSWRLDLSRPTVEDLQGTHALRVDGRVRSEKPIAFVMWLAASDDRTPLRIELSNDDVRVVADLVRE
jgi:hypothetical protein